MSWRCETGRVHMYQCINGNTDPTAYRQRGAAPPAHRSVGGTSHALSVAGSSSSCPDRRDVCKSTFTSWSLRRSARPMLMLRASWAARRQGTDQLRWPFAERRRVPRAPARRRPAVHQHPLAMGAPTTIIVTSAPSPVCAAAPWRPSPRRRSPRPCPRRWGSARHPRPHHRLRRHLPAPPTSAPPGAQAPR